MIIAREKVASRLVRAREHTETVEEACAVVARELAIPIEAVREVAAESMAESDGELA